MTESQTFETPHAGWWIGVLGGLGLLALLAFDDGAYAVWSRTVTTVLPQALLRAIFVGAVVTHVGEALYALHLVRRIGLGGSTLRWFGQTLALGFPSLRLLRRRARRAAAQP